MSLPWPTAFQKTFKHSFFRLGDRAEARLRRVIRPISAQLKAACGPLEALTGEIEKRFLACGRALHEQVRLTSQLGEQSRQLNEFGERVHRNEAAIRRVGALIATHLTLSEDLSREVERLAVTLDGHGGQLEQLLRDQRQLERSFAPMRVLHSLFRIESTALPEELQGLFHAVTAEMQRLHTDVSAGFADQAEALDETRKQVIVTAGRLHIQAAQHAELTARKRADVQQSLTHLDVELAKGRQRNERLESAIGDLNRETDAIAVSLQYEDITRQKMEHVQTAARDVLDQCTNRGDAPFQRHVRVQQVLCQVQAVQLASVQEELERATGTITSGLNGLLDRLQWIERECLSVAGLEQVTADTDAVTAEMIEAHRLSANLMDGSLASLTQAIQTARGFAEATTSATDMMRRVAADLHVMSLNAQIQAVQADNRCLEVLSSAASAISSEAGALTLAFERKLVATTGELAAFVRSSEAFHAKTGAHHAELQAQDETIFRQLNEEREAGNARVLEVGSLLLQLKEQADELLRSVDLADFSRDAITGTRDLFAGLAKAYAAASDGDALGDETILADVQGRYTMNSERAAHAAVLAGQATISPINSSAPSADTELNRVELFDQPAPVAASNDSSLGNNVELF